MRRNRIVKTGKPLLIEDFFENPIVMTTLDLLFEVHRMRDGYNPCSAPLLLKL